MCGSCLVDGLEWEEEQDSEPAPIDRDSEADRGADEYERWFWRLG